MKQTAVEWFFRWVNDNPEATHKEYAEAFEQAKEMEKQQILKAWNNGATGHKNIMTYHNTAEEYFNYNYKP